MTDCPLDLAIGESICLRYVLHGEPVTEAAVLIGHHSEFAVLDEAPKENRPARPGDQRGG